MRDDKPEDQLHELREAVRPPGYRGPEPRRLTFELHLLTLGLSREEQTGARVVVALLLGAAEGEPPRTGLVRRRAAHAAPLPATNTGRARSWNRQRTAVIHGHALDVHPYVARRLLDAHKSDGKGLTGHAALDSG